MVAMFRMVECLLELRAGEVWAQATMKKPFPMAAFRDAAFAIEHVAFAGLAPWAVRLLLPFAYPAVCAAHADLLFVHSFHPFNCHNGEPELPQSRLKRPVRRSADKGPSPVNSNTRRYTSKQTSYP